MNKNVAIWLTSVDQVQTATDSSLKLSLITPDGRGVILKEAALDELLHRSHKGRTNEQEDTDTGH